MLRWRPRPGIEVMPFWSLYNDYNDEAGPYYLPANKVLPPNPAERVFDGPGWAQFRYTDTNYGLVASAALTPNWLFRLGAFRSVNDQIAAFTNLMSANRRTAPPTI